MSSTAAPPTTWASAAGAQPSGTPGAMPPPLFDPRGQVTKDEVASWGARFGASILNNVILMVMLGLAVGAMIGLFSALDPEGARDTAEWFDAESYESSPDPSGGWIAAIVAVPLLLLGWWEIWLVRSPRLLARPGHLVAGFRIVSAADAQPLTFGRATGRMLGKLPYYIPQLGFLVYVASAVTIGTSERRQALHDMIAGTACVRRDALARRGVGPDATRVPLGVPPTPTAPTAHPPSPTSSGPFV